MTSSSSPLTSLFRLGLLLGVLGLDQASKYWARVRFSLPNGEPDYFQSIPVLGNWLEFRLVFNSGAAFGMKPQNILPFLHPTLFYVIFSLAAIVFLAVYYRKLGGEDQSSRLGVILILAGAFGNLIDRLAFHRVTDFIDAGIPGFHPRWPTFNVADSSVCIGMALLLLAPLWAAKRKSAPASGHAAAVSPAESGAGGGTDGRVGA
jgi:signal peptidase II